MFASNESGSMEYAALTQRSRAVEQGGQWAWVVSTLTSAVLFAWAVHSASPALMLPVVLAASVGFHAWNRARQQTALIAGYIEECLEGRAGGPQWHARLAQMQSAPGTSAADVWTATGITNLVTIAAMLCSWMFAEAASHGELFAGLVTALGVVFAFHSVTETARTAQTDHRALWRKAGAGRTEMERSRSAAA